MGFCTELAWIEDISMPKKEAITPANSIRWEAEEKSGRKLSVEKEIWIGFPWKYHTDPSPIMRKLGIKVPHIAPMLLIQEEILRPKKFTMVAPQNRMRIKLTM